MINVEQVYEMFAQGMSTLQVAAQLNLTILEWEQLYDENIDLQKATEQGKRFHYEQEYEQSLRAKPSENISKEDLVKAIADKIKSGRYTLKDIEGAWNILFPEDDYKRHKSNKDIEIAMYNAITQRMKVEKDTELSQTISDEFLSLIKDKVRDEIE